MPGCSDCYSRFKANGSGMASVLTGPTGVGLSWLSRCTPQLLQLNVQQQSGWSLRGPLALPHPGVPEAVADQWLIRAPAFAAAEPEGWVWAGGMSSAPGDSCSSPADSSSLCSFCKQRSLYWFIFLRNVFTPLVTELFFRLNANCFQNK